jgi:hypothetical protein
VRRDDYGYVLRARYPQTALVAQVLGWFEAQAAQSHLPTWASRTPEPLASHQAQ